MRPGFKKVSPGILYLHIADDGCFLAVGFYGLERPVLDAIRAGIRDDAAAFAAALAAAEEAMLSLDTSDSMTRMPRGFEDVGNPALIPALKARHLILRRALSKRQVGAASLVGVLVDATEAAAPFLRLGWEAMADAGPPPEWSRLG